MNITLTVSEENEATSYPWWIIVDPRQSFRCNPHEIASMITGPFFSRKEAQDFLDATRYNFSKRAVVYCASGHNSRQYREAITMGRMASPGVKA